MKYLVLPTSKKRFFRGSGMRKNITKIPLLSEEKLVLSKFIHKKRRKQFFKTNEESKQFRESYIKQYQALLKQ
ncbi:hypothetical protein [Bacillus thuringiensis]|uniref:Uncharacterized protein n=1 Tax=Bacillus thuringiensis TaxID=1428 RepID=A0A9X6WSQ4_BACTU|nr:hypothetical protein [Bacillus thuringiensis]PFJ42766.1 hypothetical protein COJ15_05340 [Bacillus thuringiensis]